MQNVTDFEPFATTAQLLADLSNELETLTAEHQTVAEKLMFKNVLMPENLSVEEAARRVAAGGSPNRNATKVQEELRDTELKLRERINDIREALRNLPQHLEYQRQRAQRARLEELRGDLEKIRADFAEAQKAMMAAALAESSLIERLVVGGFGSAEPFLTAPHWLNRQQLLLQTVE